MGETESHQDNVASAVYSVSYSIFTCKASSKPGSLDEIINIFDDVSTSQLTQPNSIVFFLGSVTHELYQGCVVNYFLQKRGVDLKPGPGNWIEYKVKTYPISKVRIIYY